MSTPTIDTPKKTNPQSQSATTSGGPHIDAGDLQAQPAKETWKSILQADRTKKITLKEIDWTVLLWIGGMHAGCVAAPFFFSWSALGVCIFLHWVTCSIGICLAYHRYLSHRSFKMSKPAEFGTLLCGVLSGEGTPLMWAATHRMHHQLSDHDGDPHSPLDGKWWSHMMWVFVRHDPKYQEMLYKRYASELMERPLIQFFERTFGMWLMGSGAALFGLGWALGGLTGAIGMLVWGLCVRQTAAYHTTWLINSATHIWGYRNYETRDQSRNIWWVALLAYGEGWHNNHHAHPTLAPAGHRWWEADITWWSIKLLRFFGQATDVNDTIPNDRFKTTEETTDDESAELPALTAFRALRAE